MSRRIATVLVPIALALGTSLALPAATASGTPTAPAAPFNECPAIGGDTSCGILLVVNPDNTVSVYSDGSQGPYDGADDTLVGIVNDSANTVASLPLSSDTNIFGFENDGVCTFAPGGPSNNPSNPGSTGYSYCSAGQLAGSDYSSSTDPLFGDDYEGPDNTWSNISADTTSGTVDFTTPIAANGGSTFFSLEASLAATDITPGQPGTGGTGTQAQPTIGTTPSASVTVGGNVSDTATVSGGNSPTGTVTFNLYGPGDTKCATPLSTVKANLSGGTASSGNLVANAAGTYNWTATYNGDSNNLTASSGCGSETVNVTQAVAGITTTPSGSVGIGGSISDSATVTGFNPTGTVTFNLYAPGDTKCATSISTKTVSLSGGTASSGNDTASLPGTYNWTASYSGDANNTTANEGCGSETVTVTAPVMTGRAYAISATASVLGSAVVNVQPTRDTGNISTELPSTTTIPCVATLLTNIVNVGAVCENVTTLIGPSRSIATASVANVSVGSVFFPAIALQAVATSSVTSCRGSIGTTTIAYLRVGGAVLISHPTRIRPNTKISILGITITLNQQQHIWGPDHGLLVNGVVVDVNLAPLATAHVVLASSESDIGNCPSVHPS